MILNNYFLDEEYNLIFKLDDKIVVYNTENFKYKVLI